jgi:predicted acetyltransferase
MMEAQLAHARAVGEPIAALWASEETIYGRFGYGLAGHCLILDADRTKVRIGAGAPVEGKVRLVDHDEALRTFPPVYERIRRRMPGMLRRSRTWWEIRRLSDRPEQRRGGGPLVRALLERDGRPVGYATYRIASSGSTPIDWKKTVRVIEAHGIDDAATRDIWRFLFEIDWTDRVAVFDLPLDHPLLRLADRVNELHATLLDALWLRVLDVDTALGARSYKPGRATVEVASDPQFPDNVGVWRIADGKARRARAGARADVRLPVDALGAAYLGGVSIGQLVRAGEAEELVRGGAARADAVLAVDRQPWCAEVF